MPVTIDTSYPGGKGAAGTAERIAGLFPPHRYYFEFFLGHGRVMRLKRRAERNIGVDADPAVVGRWAAAALDGIDVAQGDVLRILPPLMAWLEENAADTVCYFDPPYLRETRTRLFYDCEFSTPAEHSALLSLLLQMRCRVALSGYWSPLYASMLQGWRLVRFPSMTRGGVREECVWLNYPEPVAYHDPVYACVGYRERERVKKRRRRWIDRLRRMTPAERQVVLEALTVVNGGADLTAESGDVAGVAPGSTAGNGVAGSRTARNGGQIRTADPLAIIAQLPLFLPRPSPELAVVAANGRPESK
jgi:DNA adenine methylase